MVTLAELGISPSTANVLYDGAVKIHDVLTNYRKAHRYLDLVLYPADIRNGVPPEDATLVDIKYSNVIANLADTIVLDYGHGTKTLKQR